ncbi:MAG: tRNA (adenosine(37)-N6)-threonylcarbamoyltransferase complex dimerization subunit type 1 TsaB [Chloroflexota bacterium]|nr:tRNA (adenosine(37)-N6)-threonylcarbamoyltransferase complex dimerization subunit type 1 TsaB [Chloroflexota bacterium]
MELAIDTSSALASVALASRGEVVGELTWQTGRNHTAHLLPNLVHILGLAGVGVESLEGIIIAQGPGSFNGLRVGMSTAKGLAFALEVPLVGIGTLEAEAYPHAYTGLPLCPLFDAGRGEIATATFQRRKGQWLKLEEERLTTLEELCAHTRGRTVFCGQVSPVAARLREALGTKAIIPDGAALLRRAGALAELGWLRLRDGDRDDPATLQPLYLRRPAITIPKPREMERRVP